MAHHPHIRMSVTEKAKIVASSLLEDGDFQRVCAACEKEFGVAVEEPGKRKSHGMCKRHTYEYYKDALPLKMLQKIMHEPESAFSPDMTKERQSA